MSLGVRKQLIHNTKKKVMNRDVTQGTVFRVQTDGVCFNPLIPYDTSCDSRYHGTAFLMRVPQTNTTVVLTAHHVVENANSVLMSSQDINKGDPIECDVFAINPYLDVAVLKCDIPQNDDPKAFECGSSNTLRPSDDFLALGFADATYYLNTTKGILSGKRDYPHNRFQTDAAINGGNSGGPILNAKGHVVGICTSGMDGMQNMNFFVGIDEVLLMLCRLKHRQPNEAGALVDEGFNLDATLVPVDEEACSRPNGGMLVSASRENIGLREGDIIVECMDPGGEWKQVNSFGKIRSAYVYAHDNVDLRTSLDFVGAEDVVYKWSLRVWRGNQKVVVQVLCGPPRVPSKTILPDVEEVVFCNVGGLIFQNMSNGIYSELLKICPPHALPCVNTPDAKIDSMCVCTHVMSGSPYMKHGMTRMLGCVLKGVIADQDVTHILPVKNLQSLISITKNNLHLKVLVLNTGHRVGASFDDLSRFHSSNSHVPPGRNVRRSKPKERV